MASVTLYHNPRCSKSRTALQLLTDHGANVKIIKYLETPPSEAQLLKLLDSLGKDAANVLRTGEAEFQELGLKGRDLQRAETAKLLATYPRLLQRPIAVCGANALIGRPPERVLELL